MLESENKELRQKMDRLTEQFLNAQRAKFGQSSEKTEYVMADQLRLFNEAEASEEAKPTEVTVSAHKRTKKPKRTLEELKKTLPKREVILDIPDERLVCAKCGGKLKAIGKKFLRTELVLIPARMELVAGWSLWIITREHTPARTVNRRRDLRPSIRQNRHLLFLSTAWRQLLL